MNNLKSRYVCCDCNRHHDEEDDARECCAPEIKEVFLCPLCLDDHDSEGEAFECCGFDPDGPPPPPTKKELEAAGQMRLPI